MDYGDFGLPVAACNGDAKTACAVDDIVLQRLIEYLNQRPVCASRRASARARAAACSRIAGSSCPRPFSRRRIVSPCNGLPLPRMRVATPDFGPVPSAFVVPWRSRSPSARRSFSENRESMHSSVHLISQEACSVCAENTAGSSGQYTLARRRSRTYGANAGPTSLHGKHGSKCFGGGRPTMSDICAGTRLYCVSTTASGDTGMTGLPEPVP